MRTADTLNLGCLCSTLQPALLRKQLESNPLLQGLAEDLVATRPHLFSATPVFISARDHALLEASVAALHRVAALPGYRDAALRRSPEIASLDFGPQGAFMGYDFHVSADGPRLIEINTNAGGAMLHAAAVRAHRACCTPLDRMFGAPADVDRIDDTWVEMFRTEWRAQRGDAPLRSVAIVDDSPAQQYLAPEFEIARHLFIARGIDAVVADPAELDWRDGRLWNAGLPAGQPVDLVYNRLTDFDLSEPRHASLRDAYVAGAVVMTPNPRAHALHADKRNLVVLSNDSLLASWGATAEDRALLQAVVPKTEPVTGADAQDLWTRRRQLFFKPATGYGSKAAFRGDKLTKRVWDEIVAGNFVAQALVPPSERLVDVAGAPTRLKLDIRAYAYAGRIQLLAARTYAGQTTNFRTAGGGFSPVVVLPLLNDTDKKTELETVNTCEC
ncbi:MAG: hypothetical protein K0Q43_3728 [Ramlibacter sp.]|jgi:hypothetical protein|nr:hypothetical protein [Ramlibacter sp.]